MSILFLDKGCQGCQKKKSILLIVSNIYLTFTVCNHGLHVQSGESKENTKDASDLHQNCPGKNK